MSLPHEDAEPQPTTATGSSSPVPPVLGARQVVGASLDLILRSGDAMRQASFYIGAIALALIGPLALAVWGLVVVDPGTTLDPVSATALEGWFNLLLVMALGGLLVAIVEAQGVAIAVLGGAYAGRPLDVREAVQRSRMVFWSLVIALVIVSLPAALVRLAIGEATERQVVLGLLAGIAVQYPFVYAPAGIVLGGAGALEALRRSVRIVGARKVAALVVAVLPAAFGLLIGLGISAGIDLVIRAVDAVGLSRDSGSAGQAILTALILVLVFALGTLILTASAIISAPQVVMFIGLTRAAAGLDAVRHGGSHALATPGRRRFRWLPLPMRLATGIGVIGVAALLSLVSG